MNQLLIETHAAQPPALLPGAHHPGGFMQKVVLGLSASLLAGLLAGCGSSGSGAFRAETRYAAAEEDSFATTVETLESEEELRLPMIQQGYRLQGANYSPSISRPRAVFTLRMEEDGRSVTIETSGGPFTWEPGAVNVRDGTITAFGLAGEDGLTELDLESRYFEYVHFGVWEVVTRNADFEHERTQGAAFRQGFETDPAAMPTQGSASYQGESIGKVLSGGEPSLALHGTFILTADFASGEVQGMIDHHGNFNNIQLSLGDIHDGNRFRGDAVTVDFEGAGFFSASGRYEGGFYGPGAEEVGGTWQVRDGDNIAVGAFGGPQ